jgi:prepilin-type N-terminal cleavage/methylation domain-containing protein
MKNRLSGTGGFTLVELLVVTAILGLVIGALYSMFLTHMRTTYTQDEVVEVQQNLRIAMDAISRDLKMAGALVPYGTDAIDSATTATNLIINTGTPTDTVARIKTSTSIDVGDTETSHAFTVDSPNMLDNFEEDDTVRIIRPFDGSQPFDSTVMGNLKVASKTATTISLKRVDEAPFGTATTIKNGDIISKISAAAASRIDKITYSVGSCPVGTGLSEKCLYRTINGEAADVSNVVATNIDNVNFTLLTEDSYGSSSNTAVQVTINGVTVKRASSTDQARTRQLASIVKLRNRRYY